MAITIEILVQPRASRAKIGPMHDGRIKIAVAAPPVDGEANAALCKLLAKALGVPRTSVSIVRGGSSRDKVVRVDGMEPADAHARLGL